MLRVWGLIILFTLPQLVRADTVFKDTIESYINQGRFDEALKLVEDSFMLSKDKIKFEKLKVYVLAKSGRTIDATNEYLKFKQATGQDYPELLHAVPIGVFSTDNYPLAYKVARRLAQLHDTEAQQAICSMILRVENKQRPPLIKALYSISDVSSIPSLIKMAKQARSYQEAFALSPLLSRMLGLREKSLVDSLIRYNNVWTKVIGLWIKGDMFNVGESFFTPYLNNSNEFITLMAIIGRLKQIRNPDLSHFNIYLKSKNFGIRRTLAYHLQLFGKQAIPYLVLLASDPNPVVRMEAAKSLSFMGSPRGVGTFLKDLAYLSPQKKIKAIDNLGMLGDSLAVPYIARALTNSPYPAVKVHAIWALAFIGSAASRNILIKLFNVQDTLISRESAFALAYLGESVGIMRLIRAFRNGNDYSRKRAVWLLVKLNDKRTYKYFVDGLKDSSVEVRTMSAMGLWNLLKEEERVNKDGGGYER